jgi:hypothetical protein
MFRGHLARVLVVAALGGSLIVSACGRDATLPPADTGPGGAVGAAATAPVGSAGTLREPKAKLQDDLSALLERHVALVLLTTAPLAKGQPGDPATRGQLDQNSDAITASIVDVFGSDAQVFGDGWRRHVQAFIDYAEATGRHDDAARADARARLGAYPKQVGGFLANADPYLTASGVADLIAAHIADVVPVIDAQAAGSAVDSTDVANQSDHAITHMAAVAAALTDGFAHQFPDRFPG